MVIFHVRCDLWCLYSCHFVIYENNIYVTHSMLSLEQRLSNLRKVVQHVVCYTAVFSVVTQRSSSLVGRSIA